MKLHKQINRWSCVPTSFAMVVDVVPSFFIDCIGHDGSEIIHPELEEPFRRRAFSLTECIHVCYNLGYSVTPFEALPKNRILDYVINVWTEEEANKRIALILAREKGVITGCTLNDRRHAVAWDGERIYNPGISVITSLDQIRIDTFWCVQSNPNKENA